MEQHFWTSTSEVGKPMAEITSAISATQAEYIRQELAASIFFAMPRADADDDTKFAAYNRIRQLVHIVEMIDGKEPDDIHCAGCGKAFGPKDVCFTYSYEDDTLDFCAECNDGEAPAGIAHDPRDADRDIERGRAFMAEFMSRGEDTSDLKAEGNGNG